MQHKRKKQDKLLHKSKPAIRVRGVFPFSSTNSAVDVSLVFKIAVDFTLQHRQKAKALQMFINVL